MHVAGFDQDMGRPPLGLVSQTPPYIGITELPHPPLCYVPLALPQRLLLDQDVETQLYAARLVSILLYLLAVAGVYTLARAGHERSDGSIALGLAGASDLCYDGRPERPVRRTHDRAS